MALLPKKEHMNPKQFEAHAIGTLKAQGFRITMPRTSVIRILANAGTALSAYEIHNACLAADYKLDIVSVYRILSTMLECKLIYKVGRVDGYIIRVTGSGCLEINKTTGIVKEVEPSSYEANVIIAHVRNNVTWWQFETEVA